MKRCPCGKRWRRWRMLRGQLVLAFEYCRAARPMCRASRHLAGVVCRCGGSPYLKGTSDRSTPPHRLGCKRCEHHPLHSDDMWAELERPIRRRA